LNYSFLADYSRYRETNDRHAGEDFASHMHRLLSSWVEHGSPDEGFVEQFQEFTEELQSIPPDQSDLLDLGIMHAMEALNLQKENKPQEAVRLASEARFPFLAFLDENSYRNSTNVAFHEVDFQIYERIRGNFPHEAARNYLLNSKRADLWSAIRYMESLESRSDARELISAMLSRRVVVPEKLILLAFWIFLEPDLLQNHRVEDVDSGLLDAVIQLLPPRLQEDGLDAAWVERLDPHFENELLFFLQAYFEISGNPLTPGWVCLLEKSVANHWRLTVPEFPDEVHEPNPEFAGSILHLLEEEQIEPLLKTSLIMPTFFEHMERYVDFSFYEICYGIARYDDLLREELEHFVSSLTTLPSDLMRTRLEDCAEVVGCELVIKDGSAAVERRPGLEEP
jgi:hypothetical protein